MPFERGPLAIFDRMLERKHWLHRPWIPFLKAVEGGAFQGLEVAHPVLDLACGDGVFTQCVFPGPFEAGLDLNLDDLKKARARGTHGGLVRASAYEIPFQTGHFGTVISVCAIEHMPELDRVLSETARVLRPGGSFIFSVPSVYFGESLLTPTIYKMLGLKDKARRYADRKNARSQHYHVLDVSEWEQRLKAAGMDVSTWGYVLDRRVLLLWSFMGSVFFKPLMYPFRALGADTADRFLKRALTAWLGGTVRDSALADKEEGGYLVVKAVRRPV